MSWIAKLPTPLRAHDDALAALVEADSPID